MMNSVNALSYPCKQSLLHEKRWLGQLKWFLAQRHLMTFHSTWCNSFFLRCPVQSVYWLSKPSFYLYFFPWKNDKTRSIDAYCSKHWTTISVRLLKIADQCLGHYATSCVWLERVSKYSTSFYWNKVWMSRLVNIFTKTILTLGVHWYFTYTSYIVCHNFDPYF